MNGSKRADSPKESGKTAEDERSEIAWRTTEKSAFAQIMRTEPHVSLVRDPMSSKTVTISVAVSVQRGQASGYQFFHIDAPSPAFRCSDSAPPMVPSHRNYVRSASSRSRTAPVMS